MATAQERIYRTADGRLISEADVQDGKSGGLGTGLAYAVGDELDPEDAKAFKSGKPAAKADEARDVSAPNTIEISNPAANPVTNPAKKPAAKK